MYKIWWNFLHYMSFEYPTDEKFEDLVKESIKHLSCSVCRNHSEFFFERRKWTKANIMLFKLHNDVNIRKRTPMMLWDDCVKMYSSQTAREKEKNIWKFICMIVKKSPNKKELPDFIGKYSDFFGLGLDPKNQEIYGDNGQFYLYQKYLNFKGENTPEKKYSFNKIIYL